MGSLVRQAEDPIMCPWGVSGSSATEHDPSACGTQTWTYYALDISLVGRRFSYLFCELLDVQLGWGPDLGTVPGHCLLPTPGTGLSPAEGHRGYPGGFGLEAEPRGASLAALSNVKGSVLGAEGQGCYVLFVCRVLSDVPIPRGQQAQCCLLRWASRTASQEAALSPQSPWASLAAGAVLCCWVPGKDLQPLQLQGMGRGG